MIYPVRPTCPIYLILLAIKLLRLSHYLGSAQIATSSWLSASTKGFLSTQQRSYLESNQLSGIRDCLFKVSAATFHIWRLSPTHITNLCLYSAHTGSSLEKG
jgi:hypothetical protein